MPYQPSPRQIQAAERGTGGRGFTREVLARWGVPWPPPAGWRSDLEHAWHLANPGHRKGKRWAQRDGGHPNGIAPNGYKRPAAAKPAPAPASTSKPLDAKGMCANPACQSRHERILITDGMQRDGTLRMVAFCSPECAAAGGYPWAGR